MKKKLIAMLTIASMLITMLPSLAFAADTNDGQNDISPGDIVTADQLVAGNEIVAGLGKYQYGTNPSSSEVQDISWIILDPSYTNMVNSSGQKKQGMYLITKNVLDTTYFKQDVSSNAYQGSDAQTWCTNFYTNILQTVDNNLGNPIKATTKSDAEYTSQQYSYKYSASNNILNNDKVFLPSAQEVDKDYLWKGQAGNSDRKATGAKTWWWLRSPTSDDDDYAGDVLDVGVVDHNYVYDILGDGGARPALNLNPESLIFKSISAGKYQVGNIQIDFDSQGGSEVKSDITCKGGTVTEPQAPTKDGYTFKGWYTAAEGGSAVNFGAATFSADTKLYAQWTEHTAVLSYNNSGLTTATIPANVTMKYTIATVAGNAMAEGYTFDGWYKNQDLSGSKILAGSNVKAANTEPVATTLYAKWKSTLKFNANGGTKPSGKLSDITMYKAGAVTIPTDVPTRTGYEFLGWNKTEGATTADPSLAAGATYKADGTYAPDATLYAVWKEKSAVLSYNNSGLSTAAMPADETMTYLEAAKASNVEAPEGYSFDGWYKNQNFTGDKILSAELIKAANVEPEATTLYAKWKSTLKFNANGGTKPSGKLGDIDMYKAGEVKIPSDEPTRTDYKFLGWATSEQATIVQYEVGDRYKSDGAYMPNKELYAVWRESAYIDIQVDTDGDGVSDSTVAGRDDGGDKDKKAGDGIYTDSEGQEYIPLDTDDDGKPDVYVAAKDDGTSPDKKAEDGIYTDDEGNEYVPVDNDGDGKPDIYVESKDDGTDPDEEAGDGIYTDEDENEYIPVDTDGDGDIDVYVQASDDGEAPDEEEGDGIYTDSEGQEYIPVDTDSDGDPDIYVPGRDDGHGGDKTSNDGIYTDEDGNEYVPVDNDGDGKPDIYVESKDDGVDPDEEADDGIYTDEDGNEYIPVDTDGDGDIDVYVKASDDGEAPDEEEGDGIYTDSEGQEYIPVDTDGDGDPDVYVAAKDDGTSPDNKADDGIYTDDEGQEYIPLDTDDDGKPDVYVAANDDGTSPDKKADDGIYTDDQGQEYIPVDTDGDGDVDKYIPAKDDGTNPDKHANDGIYTDDEGNEYVPVDTDGDGKIDECRPVKDDGTEPDEKADDSIYTDSEGQEYIPVDTDGDGDLDAYVTANDDGEDPDKKADDGIYTDDEGQEYVPIDTDKDGKPDTYIPARDDGEGKDKQAGDGIYTDDEGHEYVPVDTDSDGKADAYDPMQQGDNGIYTDDEGHEYVPVDTDGDGKSDTYIPGRDDGEGNDKQADDGIYTDDEGNEYIPVDTDDDGKPDAYYAVEQGEDAIYTDDEGHEYVPVDTNGDGKSDTYIPGRDDGEGKDKEAGDGIYTDSEGNEYKPVDTDGDGKPDVYELVRNRELDVRYAGSNRYDTSIKVADALKVELRVDKFECIVVATGGNYPDALAAGYLAGKNNAPLILTNSAQEKTTAKYIKENLKSGGKIYLIGGEGAVSARVESECKKITNGVKRLGGTDRYSTNMLILKEAGVGSEDILVCSGSGYADSLSASASGKPIFLVGASLTDAQKQYLASLSTSKYYAIGGTGAVSDKVFNEVCAIKSGAAKKRVSGDNRYATSAAVAKEFFPQTENVMLAYAKNFPDGLAGSALASALHAPLLLTDDSSAGIEAAKGYVSAAGGKYSVTLGGTTLIKDQSRDQIMSRGPQNQK